METAGLMANCNRSFIVGKIFAAVFESHTWRGKIATDAAVSAFDERFGEPVARSRPADGDLLGRCFRDELFGPANVFGAQRRLR
jgi:hypothetical protein